MDCFPVLTIPLLAVGPPQPPVIATPALTMRPDARLAAVSGSDPHHGGLLCQTGPIALKVTVGPTASTVLGQRLIKKRLDRQRKSRRLQDGHGQRS
jgi:hypothetical protein